MTPAIKTEHVYPPIPDRQFDWCAWHDGKLQKGRCAYCKAKLGSKYERDHIVPLSKGGTNYPNNIQLVCDRRSKGRDHCNQKKRNKHPMDYARERGLLI